MKQYRNFKGVRSISRLLLLLRITTESILLAKKAFKAMGGEMKQFYLVMGQYDMVVIEEAPDDETAAKLSLAIGSQGAIRTETMRAFTEEEYRKIIQALP